LGLALLLHRSIASFLKSIDQSISDASGILIQFPLYFGIMGIMSGSGLIQEISNWLTAAASANSLPILSFFSAGIVNFFVPSGGGQWYIQGPMLIQSALDLGVSIPKTIMALSYGDQWTNMLQPFWALPLMGITRLKAGELLPYTFVLFSNWRNNLSFSSFNFLGRRGII
jgi:short-chain fatty acids transporter